MGNCVIKATPWVRSFPAPVGLILSDFLIYQGVGLPSPVGLMSVVFPLQSKEVDMKLIWNLAKGLVEVEGDTSKECFDRIADAAEIFNAISRCGACDSQNTAPIVRENKGVTFREAKCMDCGCTLGLGMKKADGSLFPKRKAADGSWMDHGGWHRYQPQAKVEVKADEFESF